MVYSSGLLTPQPPSPTSTSSRSQFLWNRLKRSSVQLTHVLPLLFREISTCRSLRQVKYVSYTLHRDSVILSILVLLLSLCLCVCLSLCVGLYVSISLSVPLSVPPPLSFRLKHLSICQRPPPQYSSMYGLWTRILLHNHSRIIYSLKLSIDLVLLSNIQPTSKCP